MHIKSSVKVGRFFIQKQGNVVEVQNVCEDYVDISCKVCSSREEPYPEVFKMKLKSFLKGCNICGCNVNNPYPLEVITYKIRKRCVAFNCTFKGFVGDYQNRRSKIILSKIGYLDWTTCTVDNFLHKRTRYPESLNLDKNTSDINTKELLLYKHSKYPEGTLFTHAAGVKDGRGKEYFWYVTCSICKEDIFSLEGDIEPSILRHYTNIRQGAVSCRCAKSGHRYTKEERLFQINKRCKSELFQVNQVPDQLRTRSLINVTCSRGHTSDVTIESFVNLKSKCQICVYEDTSYGFLKLRSFEYGDNLYLMLLKMDNEIFLKVGRSFDIIRRIKHIENTSSYKVLFYTVLFTGTHKDIYKKEYELLKNLRVKGLTYKPNYHFGGSGECFLLKTFTFKCIEEFYTFSFEPFYTPSCDIPFSPVYLPHGKKFLHCM